LPQLYLDSNLDKVCSQEVYNPCPTICEIYTIYLPRFEKIQLFKHS
jgi:hypothetical protein